MKSHAQVVIIGGGSLGVNLMNHLGLEGWTKSFYEGHSMNSKNIFIIHSRIFLNAN
ncbi:hypothetical protein OAV81_05465 [Candidatus Thioglobus sp.]|nr:hypothetical protein [Candidatus Thioglobus sp.]